MTRRHLPEDSLVCHLPAAPCGGTVPGSKVFPLLSLNQVLPRSSKDHVGITVSVFTSDPQPLSIHTGCIQFRIATFLVFSQAIGETSSTAKTVYSARQEKVWCCATWKKLGEDCV